MSFFLSIPGVTFDVYSTGIIYIREWWGKQARIMVRFAGSGW
jgi:hypothetical protein